MDMSLFSHKSTNNLEIALKQEIQRREDSKLEKSSNLYILKMVLSSVKEAEARQQLKLENLIKSKDEEILFLRKKCASLENERIEFAKFKDNILTEEKANEEERKRDEIARDNARNYQCWLIEQKKKEELEKETIEEQSFQIF